MRHLDYLHLPIQEKGAKGQGPPKRALEETHEHRKAKEVLGTSEINFQLREMTVFHMKEEG